MSNLDLPSFHILIVEAHSLSRKLLGQQCAELGFRTSLVGDAREALELSCQISFDLAFIDLSIRKVDACFLARMLREQGAVLVMVAVSCTASRKLSQRCRDAGFNELLVKPISVAAIEFVVRRLMTALPLSAAKASRPPKTMALTHGLLLQLAEITELSLSKIRIAIFRKRHDLVLQELHAIKGVFAMQNQSEVVAACQRLESAVEKEISEDFLRQICSFHVLIRDNMRDMLISADDLAQDEAEK